MIKITPLLLILFLFSGISHANLLKSGFNAEYDVNYNGIELGVSKRNLSFKDAQHATYESSTIPEGFAALLIKETVKETSHLTITHKQIQPTLYNSTKDKKGQIETHQLEFDWDKNNFTNSYLKTTESLSPNTHDLLSFQLSIMQNLQNNIKNMQYRIATKKHTRTYNLYFLQKEKLQTELGEFEVVKLESGKIKGNSKFTFWCAPALEYLPIKIQKVNDKGDKFSFSLRAFSVNK